ncbi:MAG: protein kinase, partial [Elusimicrobia bacterium]|nr:protein kinase [Elusimicrobiota bacterium]
AAALGAGGREGFASYGSASASPAAAAALVSPGATRAAADQALAGAKSALKLGDAESALDTLTKALEQDPNNPALLNMRAQVYGRLGRWEEALRDVRAGLALAPGNVALLTTKAIAENRTRRWNDALATANEMLAADPNNAWAYAARAHAYGGLGRKDDMMRDILRAASLDAHFRQAAEDAKNIQLPSDADVMFLFPGESAKSATKSAPAASGRGRSFSVLVIAGIVGGLLLALGLLSIVMEPVKNAVTAVFTKRSESDPRAAVATAQPASVGGNVGGLIRGQYQIARQIGAGGMGMVYEGTDKSLGRRVAIKKMRDELRLNARERDRFIIEAKTVASLHHPNIVDIYAIAEEGDDVYLVFEYVDGKTVHDLVQTAGRLEPADAVNVARAMGEALTYAHAHGVIHRDMKPSNVMKTSSGQIKVMDFGIARMAKDAMTRYSMTNTVVGTPPYMAPEQEQGVVRKESDVYSLAICAYEMLTGKLPFIGMGAGMLMNKINMSYIPPSRAIAGLPESLDEVFLKAFQADPEKRYRTPQEFVAALGGSLGARAKSS